MAAAVVDAHLDAPVDAVASVLADPRTYDGTVVGTRRIRWFDAGWPAPGSRFHHTVGFGPITLRDRSEVLADELPDRIELAVGIRPLGALRVELRLRPEGAGTRVEMVEEPLSGAVGRLWCSPVEWSTRRRNAEVLRRLGQLAGERARVRALDDRGAPAGPG